MNLKGMLTVISGTCIIFAILLKWLDSYSPVIYILYLVAITSAGYFIIWAAIRGILEQKILNIDFLVSLAVLGALYINELGEAAAVMFFFSLAEVFEEFGIERSRKTLALLLQKSPKKARLKRGEQILIEDAQINDVIIVRPGDIIPLDGTVIDGYSAVDEAAITGESIPKDKRPGNIVFAGSTNMSGYLEIKVTKQSKDSTFAKIIEFIEKAQQSRLPLQRFVDTFAQFYTPTVIIIAILIVFLPPFLGFGTINEWLYQGLVLLLIACPCALVVAAPISIAAGIGRASQAGVLIKGGKYLELFGRLKAVAFDKTKTITEGSMSVTNVVTFNKFSEEEVLADAAGLEEFSSHPIAQSIVEYVKKRGIPFHPMKDYVNFAGKGGKATCFICKFPEHCIGNIKLIANPQFHEIIKEKIEELEKQGKTVVLINEKDVIKGAIAASDIIRSTALPTIKSLNEAGIKTIMITGDNNNAAHFIAKQVQVEDVYAQLLPEEKVEKIKSLKKYGVVAMVGDGVNDAPALAAADIGIAMGAGGSDVAIETADVVLMNNNLLNILFAIRLGAKTLFTIKLNIIVSIITKMIFLVLALLGIVRLEHAIASDAILAILVIINSLNLFRFKI